MSKLTTAAVKSGLEKLPGWSVSEESIVKQYTFPSFLEAMKFVNRVADVAEQEDHHPDILINYRRVTFTLSTHSEGGLTKKDLELAKKIEIELAN